MIKKISTLKKHHQLFFSFIVVTGVTAVWRGIWGLLDMYLFPDNMELSYVVSLLLGIGIIATTHYTIDKVV